MSDGEILTVGGKTGSGDNRFETFSRSGAVITSRATNRTATFVFYIGERYFGVITAYVQGREADNYRFTSGLPVSLLKLMAPTLLAKLDKNPQAQPAASRRSRAPCQPSGRPNRSNIRIRDSTKLIGRASQTILTVRINRTAISSRRAAKNFLCAAPIAEKLDMQPRRKTIAVIAGTA